MSTKKRVVNFNILLLTLKEQSGKIKYEGTLTVQSVHMYSVTIIFTFEGVTNGKVSA